MTRKEELTKFLSGKADKSMTERLIDEVIFQELKLEELKQLPFIKINPKDASQQKATPASKLYISLMAQYNANIRTLAHLSGASENDEESPLRMWAKKNAK